MKKYSLISWLPAALAIFMALSCSVKELESDQPAGMSDGPVYHVTIEEHTSPVTKTYLSSNTKVLWHKDDQLGVADFKTGISTYKFSGATGDKGGDIVPTYTVSYGETTDYRAAYFPLGNLNYANTDGTLLVSLPGTQKWRENSFGPGDNPMVAYTHNPDDNTLFFRNICGILALEFYGDIGSKYYIDVVSLELQSNDGSLLCGNAKVSLNGDRPEIVELYGGSSTVTLSAPSAAISSYSSQSTVFMFVLPPGTYKGITVNGKCRGGNFTVSTDNTVTIERSIITRMEKLKVTVEPSHQAIDLGLPSGIKWADCNVGAEKPTDIGDYFAWGETETKANSKYTWTDYQFRTSGTTNTDVQFSMYNTLEKYGTVDNQCTLSQGHDAAYKALDSPWRMPTRAEADELVSKCTWTETETDGVAGYDVMGPNGNSIFIPKTGYRSAEESVQYPSRVYLWTSSLMSTYPYYASILFCNGSSHYTYSRERYCGLAVRPVRGTNTLSVTSVTVSMSSTSVYVSKTEQLSATVSPSTASDKKVSWESSDTKVATVNTSGLVRGVKAGTAVITAKTNDGAFTATCTVTVLDLPDVVDLGLPSGLKWATCNIGAASETEAGLRFAWGETAPKNANNLQEYKFYESGTDFSDAVLSKYNSTDGLTRLETQDDAAYVRLGKTWRMPTVEDINELKKNTTYAKETRDGVTGVVFTSKKSDASIFIRVYSGNMIWSSDIGSRNYSASCLDDYISIDNLESRWNVLPIRPVQN